MSETRIDDNDINEGLYPQVFKKIDTADIQINPFQAHKTFIISSGSVTSSVLPLQGVYNDINNLPAIGSNLNWFVQNYYMVDFCFYKIND